MPRKRQRVNANRTGDAADADAPTLDSDEKSTAPEYGSKEYWDSRYAVEKTTEKEGFEWFVAFDDIEPLLQQHVSKACKVSGTIVDLGCGDSSFLFDMEKNGYRGDLYGLDYSKNVVSAMKSQSATKKSNVKFVVGDVTALEGQFAVGSVDLFIDKSTMDTLLHASSGGEESVQKMIQQVSKLLSPNGVYVIVTQMSPFEEEDMDFFSEFLVPSLDETCHWDVDVHCTGLSEGQRGIQVYVFKKGPRHGMSLRSGQTKGRLVMQTHVHGDEASG